MCPQCGGNNLSTMENDEGLTSYKQCNDCGWEGKL